MRLASVSFQRGDKSYSAELIGSSWTIPGFPAPALARMLNLLASPSDWGPSDGDPVARAASVAARVLNGTVDYVRIRHYPPDTVF